ncbi:unnamed protein product [Periconia digitata]|uniref:Nephrocystin 3-like N-terminal domain-containing protein n=1 Tax=Periconia digitata TaxID=1303443 RepID=A0A9W4UVJ0_9PLEO|nr:unnamed protein product [Periconia digitata]
MATGIEIFGIACNAMQTIQFAFNTVSLCKTIHEGGSVSPEIKVCGTELTQATQSLQKSLSQAQQRKFHGDDKEIERVALSVLETTTDLRKELAKYEKIPGGSRSSSMTKTVKFMFRKSKLEKLNEQLQSQRNIMETRVLFRLSKRTDLIQDVLDNRLDAIDTQLHVFLNRLKDGHRKLEEVVRNNNLEVQEVVRKEATETRIHTQDIAALESNLTKTHVSAELKSYELLNATRNQKDRLLRSIRFESMHTRENASAINQSHEGTFQWIFKDVTESHENPGDNLSFSEGTNGEFDDLFLGKPHEQLWDSFTEWLQSSDSFYWISGKPGSGKSSLIRFLTSEPQTEILLRRREGAEKTKVLRAFIWAAGGALQRSQKGVLATLLYQLLSDEESEARQTNIMDTLSKKYSGKSDIEDWSLKELKDTLEYLLAQSSPPTCIFIDGLDEIDSGDFGGLRGLLKLVTSLGRFHNVKLCLGSRPEPILALELSKYPQLRLQDLTRRDMLKYVTESLSEVRERYITDEEYNRLVKTIISRAEGVFLWVSLVTRRISDGLISDDWATLVERVEQLPSDLSDLYKAMWYRINEDDRPLYQSDAATFFLMILEDGHQSYFSGPTVAQMMLVARPELRRKLLAGGSQMGQDQIAAEWQMLKRQVQIRCAGLLEFPSTIHDEFGVYPIRFIHRSALDFIKDTVEGQQILLHGRYSQKQLRMWSTIATVFQYSMDTYPDMTGCILSLRDILIHVEKSLNDGSIGLSSSFVLLIQAILERSKIWTETLKAMPLECVMALAGFDSYIQHRIQELSISVKRNQSHLDELLAHSVRRFYQVIVDVDFLLPFGFSDIDNDNLETISLLLEAGADVNFSLPCYTLSDTIHHSSFVMYLFAMSFYRQYKDQKHSIRLLQTLYKFVDCGANLDNNTLVKCFQNLNHLKFGQISGFYGKRDPGDAEDRPGTLALISVQDLFLHEHTMWVETLSSNDPQLYKHISIRPLASRAPLPLEPLLGSQVSVKGVRFFRCTSQTAHIFQILEELLKDPQAKDQSKIDDLNSKIQCLTDDNFLTDDEIVSYLVGRGVLLEEVRFAADDQRILRRDHYLPLGSIKFDAVEKLDWSFEPEYDEFVAAFNEECKRSEEAK